MVVPLHNHSEFSAFDGMATVDEIIDRIKEMGSDAVGLTDHGVVTGHLAFGRACMDAGIKPIFGMEAYQARDHRTKVHKVQVINPKTPQEKRAHNDAFHLILLAKNDKGLRNLWTLSTLAYTEGFAHGRPRLDLDLLSEYREGLIATSACLGSKVTWGLTDKDTDKYAVELAEVFGDDWFIEIHTYDSEYQQKVNLELIRIADKHGWPLVYATDAHYACADEYEAHDVYNTMTMRTTMSDPNRYHHPPSLWIQDEAHIRKALSYLPKSRVDEAIKNSVDIAESCNVTLPQRRNRVPVFFPDHPKSYSTEFLIDLVEKAYTQKFPDGNEEYLDRIEKELQVIMEADLVNFFLIEWDFNKWAADNGIITGPGRGSVGGSLVAYLLGITDIDPIKYGLIFERFYNKGREKGGMPDIDTDFPEKERYDVKDYLARKYGESRVANIGSYMRLGSKACIDRVAKTLEINFNDVNEIKAIFDSTTDAGLAADWEDILQLEELEPWIEKYPELFHYIGKFHGRLYTYGIHASGFIVSDEDLEHLTPMKMDAKGVVSTQFDMRDIESLGLMKFDLLGLKNLSILNEARSIIKEKHGVDWQYWKLHHQDDLTNEEFWSLLDNGLTVGIFQVEDGNAAKGIAKNMRCRSVLDLAALVALNRPGPLRGGMVDAYLERRNGEPWTFTHEILSDVLDETYGVFVYQEQVIHYMQKIGFDLEEADNVRRIMGKKKPEEMAALKPEYMKRASQFMDRDTAEEIWYTLEDFAKYGFNKSHSVGYGIVTLWTTWTKFAYPAEYMLACMRIDGDDRSRYVAEAVRMGTNVLPPHINKSGEKADLIDGEILYGLADVKGVVKADWVIENRPFESHEQMVEILEEQNKEFLKRKKAGEVDGQSPKQRFGAGKITALFNAGAFDPLHPRDLSRKEIRELEKEYLGIVLTNDAPRILQKHRDLIDNDCTPLNQLDSEGTYFVAGAVTSYEKRKTRKGNDYATVVIDLDGFSLKCSVFGDRLYEDTLAECTPVLLSVKKTSRGVNVQDVHKLR